MSWASGLPKAAEGAEPPKKGQRLGERGDPGRRRQDQQHSNSGKAKLIDLDQLDLDEMEISDVKKMFPVMMKLVLNVAHRQRQLESIEIKTFIASSGLKSVVEARSRVKAWVQEAERLRASTPKGEIEGKIATIGSISVAAFAGLLEGLEAEGVAIGRQNQTKLTDLKTKMDQLSLLEMGEVVQLAKIADCYEEGKVKIMLSFSQRLDMSPILDSLIQVGAVYKPGMAPMGHLERVLHTQLHKMQGLMES